MKTTLRTANYQMEKDGTHYKFSELQKDHKGNVFPVALKSADDYARALIEVCNELLYKQEEVNSLLKELHK